MEYDCLFNIREPVDRATSCLFYFYNDIFQNIQHWSEKFFKHKATEEAVGAALCHNDAARMLVSGMDDNDFLKASDSSVVSNIVVTEALATLKRCVIVDLFDISPSGENWHSKALPVIKTYFPWLDKGQKILRENVSNVTVYGRPLKSQRVPHRLIKELEKLNKVDLTIYQHALLLMKQQCAALGTLMKVSLRAKQQASTSS